MLAAGELAGPADYADGWLALAVLLLVAVVAWNAGVAWWGRPTRLPVVPPAQRVDVEAVRAAHLARLDRVEAAVRAGDLDLRSAHHELSATARSFVHETTDVPARHLTLAELRERDVPAVAAAVEVMYPPEFAPGDAHAEAAWGRALRLAREVVGSR
ncbi:hypothetical protein AB0N29_03595 [Nocardioides sp. NPDC092400]|uniref:hypothetical protein n=1 Tax=Nocardioides sp. NPDC092400 TaxID=3155196 RepID=UPI0034246004